MNWKSEKQIENEKDETIKNLSKPFYAYVMPILLDWDLVDLQEASDEEYKEICKQDGRIYSLENYTAAFNDGEIDSNLDYLRILQ